MVISCKTGKELKSRKSDSVWNLFTPLSRRNKEKNSYNYYVVNKLNKDLKTQSWI